MPRLPPPAPSRRSGASVAALFGGVTLLHFLIPARDDTHLYHLLLEKAYYLPLLLAALTLGLPSVVLLLLAVSAALASHALWSWHGHRILQAELLGQIGSFWLVGILASVMVRRLRRQKCRTQRLEGEMRLARELQQSLHPSAPLRRGDFEIAGSSEPAFEVGGDFFDHFELPDGRLALLIGDVSGKGLGAAFHSVLVRKLARWHARAGLSPGRCLARLNSLLRQENEGAVFVTALLAYLDPSDGTLVGSSAGHEPPILMDPVGARPLRLAPNAVLGVLACRYRQFRLRLRPGQTLLLYTDGLPETRDAGGHELGAAGILASRARLAGRSAREQALALLEEARRAGPARDDRTVLVVQWRGGESGVRETRAASPPLPDYGFTWRVPPTIPMGHEKG